MSRPAKTPARVTPKVIVVGAGIVGTATALHLQQSGAEVVLVDRGAPGEGTSYGNAGVLAAASIVPVTMPGLWKKAPGMLLDPDGPLSLRWSYLPRLLPWLRLYLSNATLARVRHITANLTPLVANAMAEHRKLADGTPAEGHLREIPYVFVYRDRAQFEADSLGFSLRRDNGYDWEVLENGALQDSEPTLNPAYEFGVRFTEGHGVVVAPGDYVKALAEVFVSRGGTLRRATALGFETGGQSAVALTSDAGRLAADAFVIAAGAWSKGLSQSLGLKIPLESERGYHIHIAKPSVLPNQALMVADAKVVATPMDDSLRLAGMVEFGGLDAGPSAKPPKAMVRLAHKIFPKLTYTSHETWLGHRPAPADSLPFIGAAKSVPNVYLAFGHHHVGLTSGPRTGRLVADLIMGRHPNLDVAAYRPDRFN